MADNCSFCKIATGQLPAEIVYRDNTVTVFKDRKPAAPVHLLIIPNRHIASINDLQTDDEEILGRMIFIARNQAKEQGLSQNGYRLIINTGPDAGQTVFHIHLHLLGGHRLPGFSQP